MWISKPKQALSQSEVEAFASLSKSMEWPLSQTLTWAHAIAAQNANVMVVFNPEKKAGGVLFSHEGAWECVNGPCLNWDSTESAAELATLVHALAQGAKAPLSKVTLKPRWLKEKKDERVTAIPFPTFAETESATKVLPVIDEKEYLEKAGSSFRNEFNRVQRELAEIQFQKLTEQNVEKFFEGYQEFANKKGLFCPNLNWLKALCFENPYQYAEDIEFILVEAKVIGTAEVHFLVARHYKTAYYLFAFENRFSALNLSLNLWAQMKTLSFLKEKSVIRYDLNGFIVQCDEDDPYFGVNQFKKKFSGEIIEYVSPEFVFE